MQATARQAVLPLPEVLGPGALDNGVRALYKRHGESTDLTVDLSECTYVEIPELCNLIAFFSARKRRKKRTLLRAPKATEPRVILRVWRFIEALADALDSEIRDVLVPADRGIMSEPIGSYSSFSRSLHDLETNYEGDEFQVRRCPNFFGFMTYRLVKPQLDLFPAANSLVPLTEATRWQGPLIKAVLANHLRAGSGEEDEVARVVIYESLANAVQHPEASRIQVVSRFYPREDSNATPEGYSPTGAFTACVWDDGESMVTTLGRALRKVGTVRRGIFPDPWYERVLLRVRNAGVDKILEQHVVDQADEIPLSAPDELILLACLFPGVTRRIAETVGEIAKLPSASPPTTAWSNELGMGLYTLVRTVIDRCGGEVSLRSGRYFLNLKIAIDSIRSQYGVRYNASIVRFPDYVPAFKGNLLVIRIPGK